MKKITYKDLEESIYYEKMPNGLEVFMYPNVLSRNFYLAYNVRFGSVDTQFSKGNGTKYTSVPQGTAHFLEHQMFQENGGHTAFEYFTSLGSSVNAFTTYNYTSYEVTAVTNFKENLEYLLKYVENPVFKEKSVQSERGIIKEEIKMYDNTPMSVLNFACEYNLNVQDNHKYTISGNEEDIANITSEVLNTCYDTFYTPSNMFLVLTGNFSPLEALGIIKKVESSRANKTKRRVVRKYPKEPMNVEKAYEERQMDVAIPKLKIAYKLDKAKFKGISDRELKVYIDAILTTKFREVSDLYETLNEGNLMVNGLYATYDVRADYIMISFETETEYKEEVIDLIRNEFKNLKMTNEDLERVKRMFIADFILHFDDILSVAERLEDEILTNGKPDDGILEFYKNMSLTTVNSIASKIKSNNECIYYIDRLKGNDD